MFIDSSIFEQRQLYNRYVWRDIFLENYQKNLDYRKNHDFNP